MIMSAYTSINVCAQRPPPLRRVCGAARSRSADLGRIFPCLPPAASHGVGSAQSRAVPGPPVPVPCSHDGPHVRHARPARPRRPLGCLLCGRTGVAYRDTSESATLAVQESASARRASSWARQTWGREPSRRVDRGAVSDAVSAGSS